MADDDGIVLNLTPFVEKPKKKSIEASIDRAEKINKKHLVPGKRSSAPESTGKSKIKDGRKAKERKYIDPKDFTPISTLFNKNPDIPTLPESSAKSNLQKIVFTSDNVDDLLIGPRLKGNLKEQFKFSTLTHVQKLTIPTLLQGQDLMIKSPTGSGKTMCYAIPIVDKLSKLVPAVSRSDGAYAVVIVPTRELAFQAFNVIQDLCKSCISIVPGMLIGGEKCKSEKGRLRKGVNIIIATPGRLAYHLKETACLDISRVCVVVLDEADKLLDMGFAKTIREIITIFDNGISVPRQSVLLSATLSSDIKDLASVSLKNAAFIDTEKENSKKHSKKDPLKKQELVMPNSLQQYYVTVPAKLRLVSLLSFIACKVFLNKQKSKMIVFAPNIMTVKFLLAVVRMSLAKYFNITGDIAKKIQILHGDMPQPDRLKAFEKFKSLEHGVLLSTDVAARGLDIKGVDWIFQYSCPTQTEDYLHRVGRTARIGEKGKSLLFILPSEINYVTMLTNSGVVLSEMKLFDILGYLMDKKKLLKGSKNELKIEEAATSLQNCIEEYLVTTDELHQKAIRAYKSYIQSYTTYPTTQKDIFHVKFLHLGHVAKSFGLREAPTKFVASSGRMPVKRRHETAEQKENAKKLKLQKQAALKDGVFSGPRPGKLKVGFKSTSNKKKFAQKKKKIRI